MLVLDETTRTKCNIQPSNLPLLHPNQVVLVKIPMRVTPVTPVNVVTILIAPAVDVADQWSLR